MAWSGKLVPKTAEKVRHAYAYAIRYNVTITKACREYGLHRDTYRRYRDALGLVRIIGHRKPAIHPATARATFDLPPNRAATLLGVSFDAVIYARKQLQLGTHPRYAPYKL